VRDGEVFLTKDCPDCGVTEALVSSDPDAWQLKRDICLYDESAPLFCTTDCASCSYDHRPRMVFLDVTNRCNMNCPICIANIPGMGFEFHPPFEYFEKVLTALSRMDPKPLVQLFGGEPTVRDDIFDIIELGRGLGLDLRIVTNGLKLADEDYCRRICESRVHVLLAFDGDDPAIYERLRRNPGAYKKKKKALENLEKYAEHKNTIMCCVARGINDRHMARMLELCHEHKSIKCMHLIPLTETWEEGEFETNISTTTEDVEHIIDDAIPDEKVEFVPAGLSEWLRPAMRFFGGAPLKFGGVHPNCESGTYVISDGERYHAVSYYLKRPLTEVAAEGVRRLRDLNPRLERLDPASRWQRLRGRLMVIRTLGGLALSALRSDRILRGNRALSVARIAAGALLGRRMKEVLRRNTNVRDAMLMIVLPFEEYHSVESARLQYCFAGFAYEDADDGRVRTLPVCVWGLYKSNIQRKIADKYEARVAAG
jgi:sulfatase maturation enzyme AslB (radical SAM superfamily)